LFKERAIILIIIIEITIKTNIVKTIIIKRKIERNLNSRKIKRKLSSRTKIATTKGKELLKQ